MFRMALLELSEATELAMGQQPGGDAQREAQQRQREQSAFRSGINELLKLWDQDRMIVKNDPTNKDKANTDLATIFADQKCNEIFGAAKKTSPNYKNLNALLYQWAMNKFEPSDDNQPLSATDLERLGNLLKPVLGAAEMPPRRMKELPEALTLQGAAVPGLLARWQHEILQLKQRYDPGNTPQSGAQAIVDCAAAFANIKCDQLFKNAKKDTPGYRNTPEYKELNELLYEWGRDVLNPRVEKPKPVRSLEEATKRAEEIKLAQEAKLAREAKLAELLKPLLIAPDKPAPLRAPEADRKPHMEAERQARFGREVIELVLQEMPDGLVKDEKALRRIRALCAIERIKPTDMGTIERIARRAVPGTTEADEKARDEYRLGGIIAMMGRRMVVPHNQYERLYPGLEERYSRLIKEASSLLKQQQQRNDLKLQKVADDRVGTVFRKYDFVRRTPIAAPGKTVTDERISREARELEELLK